ncbi:hypothetical protein LC593_34000 [Nostoc sp. CHAB 5844]|nr:hypothetical protein [Nostoc sp. CHAB 5844]
MGYRSHLFTRLQTVPSIVTLFKTFSFLHGDCVDDQKAAATKVVRFITQIPARYLPSSQQNKGEFSEKEPLGKDKRSLPYKVKLPQRLSVAKATQSKSSRLSRGQTQNPGNKKTQRFL